MKTAWVLAYRYPTMDSAKHGWEAVRDMIFLDDMDASVYRSKINGYAHVVIVGNQCLTSGLQDRFAGACRGASSALLPQMIAAYLVERRRQSAIPGTFWERRGTS